MFDQAGGNLTDHPLAVFVPGLVLTLTILSLWFIGDGLRQFTEIRDTST